MYANWQVSGSECRMENGRVKVFNRSIALLALASLSFSACSNTVNWRQEVPLQDGRVLVIERESDQGPYDPFVAMKMEVGQTLTFVHPDTGERIRWKLPDGLQPYMLGFDQSVPYYVLHAYTVADYNKWNCPNPPYMVFRYAQKHWTQIPFEQLPVQFTEPNLMQMAKSYGQFINNNFASLANVQKYFARKDREYRTIGREKISPVGLGCFDSVLIKQGRQSEIDHRR